MILGLADGDAERVGANAEILREWRSPSADVAAKIEQGLEENGVVETTLTEKRELIEALERGSTKPRSHELRTLEIGLHTAVYAETYLKEQ